MERMGSSGEFFSGGAGRRDAVKNVKNMEENGIDIEARKACAPLNKRENII